MLFLMFFKEYWVFYNTLWQSFYYNDIFVLDTSEFSVCVSLYIRDNHQLPKYSTILFVKETKDTSCYRYNLCTSSCEHFF